MPTQPCPICHTWFEPRTRLQLYCQPACRPPRKRGYRRQLSAHQRGYGQPWQRLRQQARAIYGDLCHLCGHPIPAGQWSLDHLDPIAHHGRALPTIDRVRPAHQRCNSARRDRPIPPRTTRSRNW